MERFEWVQPENEENYGTRISVTVDRENSIETVRLGFKHQNGEVEQFLDRMSAHKLRDILNSALD